MPCQKAEFLAWDARLRHRGYLRKHLKASPARYRERAQLAVFDGAGRGSQGPECNLRVSGNRRRDGWHGAVEWHMHEIELALEPEHLTGQLARSAVDEGIEHEPQELIASSGSRPAVPLVAASPGGELKRIGEIAAGKTKQRVKKLGGSVPPLLKWALIALATDW